MAGRFGKILSPLLITAALMVGATLIAAACGGGDDKAQSTKSPGATTPGGGPASFDVTLGDNFFDPKEFTVNAGQRVTFNVTNGGIALHDMRVAGADNSYNTTDDAVSEPEFIANLETAVLTWTAPTKAGKYDFRCSVHPTDMFGTITVK